MSRQFAAFEDPNTPKKYNPYSNSSPISDIAKEAARVGLNPPPAIIQQAVRSFAQLAQATAQAFLESTQSDEKWLALHDELHRRFEEEYSTWEECCQAVYKSSRKVIWQRKQRAIERLSVTMDDKLILNNSEVGTSSPGNGKSSDVVLLSKKVEERALQQVEKSRDQPKAAPTPKPAPKTTTQTDSAPTNGEPKEPAIVDKAGRPIPPYAAQYWKRSTEVQHVLSALSDLRSSIRKSNESGDRLWCAFDTQDLLLSFDALYTSVSNFMPYAVCKKCNGVEVKSLCSMCHGTGLINKTTYGFNKS